MKPARAGWWHFLDRWGRHSIARVEVDPVSGEMIALLPGNRNVFKLSHPVFDHWAGEIHQPAYGPDAPPAADIEAIRAGTIPNPRRPKP